jgi:hypothetical protein
LYGEDTTGVSNTGSSMSEWPATAESCGGPDCDTTCGLIAAQAVQDNGAARVVAPPYTTTTVPATTTLPVNHTDLQVGYRSLLALI